MLYAKILRVSEELTLSLVLLQYCNQPQIQVPDIFSVSLSLSHTPHSIVSFQCHVLGIWLMHSNRNYNEQDAFKSKHSLCFVFAGPTLHFENVPQHLEVKVGETARLTCFFTGSPPIVSCWIRNKQQVILFIGLVYEYPLFSIFVSTVTVSPLLPFFSYPLVYLQILDGPELWIENTDRSSTLVIAESKPQHSGSYTVVLRDRRSSAQHTLTLSIIGKTTDPLQCQDNVKQFLQHFIHHLPTRQTTASCLLSCDLLHLCLQPCALVVGALLRRWKRHPRLCG